MVNSVGSAPYSYLDQLLTGRVKAPVAVDTSSGNKDTVIAAEGKSGLTQEILDLLKNFSSDYKTSSLLGNNTSATANNPFASLFGYSTENSASNILNDIQNDLFNTNSSSKLFQAALNGAASKRATDSLGQDRLGKIMAAYNAVVSQQSPLINITG